MVTEHETPHDHDHEQMGEHGIWTSDDHEVERPAPADWEHLRAVAIAAAESAHAPYSGLHVGAAGLTHDGRVVSGCNVENASYGLTLCAECGLVSDLHRQGGHPLIAVVVVGTDGEHLMPCGRCRQLLLEAGGPSLLIDHVPAPITLAELLPLAFVDADLPDRPS